MRRKPNETLKSSNEILASLPTASRGDLIEHWMTLYSTQPPKNISMSLLSRAIAYKIQERKSGGLKPDVKRFLSKYLDDNRTTTKATASPGTRLAREWRGCIHEVSVEHDCIIYNGEKLRSLSEAAFRITGTKWSGPRFFGLIKGK